MKHSKKEIAVLFSNGKFDKVTSHLSNGIVWNIVGGNTFKGKKAVTENCQQTAEYFKSVQTDFKTDEAIVSKNKVTVIGTGVFKRDNKQLNIISACDVYDFNDENWIEKISSSCIPEKKD